MIYKTAGILIDPELGLRKHAKAAKTIMSKLRTTFGNTESQFSSPKGLGVYIRAVQPKDINKLINKLIAAKIKWAAVATTWQTGNNQKWINSPDRCNLIQRHLIDARIEPHIWGYPWWNKSTQFVDELYKCMINPSMVFNDTSIGFTSYGNMVSDFPWEEFAKTGFIPEEECDYGSPQLYESSPDQIIKGLANYEHIGFDRIIPSYGLYNTILKNGKKTYRSKTPKEFDDHMMAFVHANPKIDTMIGWADNFITPALIPVIAKWSELLDRGAMALPPL